MTKPDPVAAALASALASSGTKGQTTIERVYSNRPEVLEAIREALDRGVTQKDIAGILTAGAPEGVVITPGQVKTWKEKTAPKTLL